MYHLIMFLLLGGAPYGPMQAHNDSLYIYNAYAASDTIFETATDANQWKQYSDSLNQVTADAFTRLKKYNASNYEPADELNKESFGSAFVFPKPGEMLVANVEPKAEVKEAPATKAPASNTVTDKEIAFKVLDDQTHFLIGPNGRGRIPYVTMNYYAKGRILVKSEKLDPITLHPLPTSAEGLAMDSNF